VKVNKKSQPSQSGMALIIMKPLPPGITRPFRRVILICFKVGFLYFFLAQKKATKKGAD
jgi:hypothetical protein